MTSQEIALQSDTLSEGDVTLTEPVEKPRERDMTLTELRSLLRDRVLIPSTSRSLAEIEKVYPDGNFNAQIGYWADGSISSVFVQTIFDSISLDGRQYQIKNGMILSPFNQAPLYHLVAQTGITFFISNNDEKNK